MQKIKKELDDDAEYIQLNYKMKVKGGDIFTETPFFGFISKHLCISAIDFVMGPFGKVVGRVGKMTLAMKALGEFLLKCAFSRFRSQTLDCVAMS